LETATAGEEGEPQLLTDLSTPIAGELEALRRVRTLRGRLDSGKIVVVNPRPGTDPETEAVSFDCARVPGVLARIIAEVDGLSDFRSIA
jgi:hypothetical protein